MNFWASPLSQIFINKLAFGADIFRANSKTELQSTMMFSWSSCLTPVAFGAISERTQFSLLPSSSSMTFCCVDSWVKSELFRKEAPCKSNCLRSISIETRMCMYIPWTGKWAVGRGRPLCLQACLESERQRYIDTQPLGTTIPGQLRNQQRWSRVEGSRIYRLSRRVSQMTDICSATSSPFPRKDQSSAVAAIPANCAPLPPWASRVSLSSIFERME